MYKLNTFSYYPFGMIMPGRNFSSDKYRFGFNGKEMDDEVRGTGNQQDYGMRIYDTRLGRFLSVDPFDKKYPELSSYQFAANNPIWNVDLDGLENANYLGLEESSTHYGLQGRDWGYAEAGGNAGVAAKNGGFDAQGNKYYFDPNAWTQNGKGAFVWQKKVTITTYETIQEEVVEKVIDIMPAIPPTAPHFEPEKRKTIGVLYDNKGFSGPTGPNILVNFIDANDIQEINNNKGKLKGIVVTFEKNNPLNTQIIATLKNKFVGVPLEVKFTTTLVPKDLQTNPDFAINFNYEIMKVVPGSPGRKEKKIERLVKKIVSKTVEKQTTVQ